MLFTPFTFQNGKTAKNRIFKSAMEEQLAQNDQPSENLSASTTLGQKAVQVCWLRAM